MTKLNVETSQTQIRSAYQMADDMGITEGTKFHGSLAPQKVCCCDNTICVRSPVHVMQLQLSDHTFARCAAHTGNGICC